MLVSGDQLRFGTAGTWTRQADDVKAPDPVTEASQAARRGEVDVAIPALRRFADEGDDAACASLAVLLAFRGEWGSASRRRAGSSPIPGQSMPATSSTT